MKHRVLKYSLPSSPCLHVVTLPKGPILDVQAQRDHIVLWMPENTELVKTTWLLVMTGELVEADFETFRFVKTLQLDGGAFVLHAFLKKGALTATAEE